MRRIKLTKYEQAIEAAIERDEFVDASPERVREIAEAIERRRKDAVISIRVNSHDLELIKKKAKRLGVGYQTLISEMLHKMVA